MRQLRKSLLIKVGSLGDPKGTVALTLYCLLTSTSAVWVNLSFSNMDGTALTFMVFIAAQLVFMSVGFARKEQPLHFLIENLLPVFVMNMLTLLSWLFMFMALQRIEASVEAAIYQGWVPLVVMACAGLERGENRKRIQYFWPLAILFFISTLVFVRLQAVGTIDQRALDGVFLATLAGIAGAIYIYYSGRVSKRTGCGIYNILSTRFILLLIVTGYIGADDISVILLQDYQLSTNLILLSIISVVLPIYLLQYSIYSLEPIRVSTVLPTVPAISLAIEYFYVDWVSPMVPILILFVCLSVIFSNLQQSKSH